MRIKIQADGDIGMNRPDMAQSIFKAAGLITENGRQTPYINDIGVHGLEKK